MVVVAESITKTPELVVYTDASQDTSGLGLLTQVVLQDPALNEQYLPRESVEIFEIELGRSKGSQRRIMHNVALSRAFRNAPRVPKPQDTGASEPPVNEPPLPPAPPTNSEPEDEDTAEEKRKPRHQFGKVFKNRREKQYFDNLPDTFRERILQPNPLSIETQKDGKSEEIDVFGKGNFEKEIEAMSTQEDEAVEVSNKRFERLRGEVAQMRPREKSAVLQDWKSYARRKEQIWKLFAFERSLNSRGEYFASVDSRQAYHTVETTDSYEVEEILLNMGADLQVYELFQAQRRFASRHGLESDFFPYISIREFRSIGELITSINGFKLVDFQSGVDNDQSDRDCFIFLVECYRFAREFDRMSELISELVPYSDEEQITGKINNDDMTALIQLEEQAYRSFAKLAKLDSQDENVNKYPINIGYGLGQLAKHVLLFTAVDFRRLSWKRHFLSSFGHEGSQAAKAITGLMQKTDTMRKNINSSLLLQQDDPKTKLLREAVTPYFLEGGVIADRALQLMMIRSPEEMRVAYRRMAELSHNGVDPEFYELMAGAVVDYYQFMGLPTRKDIEEVLIDQNEETDPSQASWNETRVLIDNILSMSSKKEYVLATDEDMMQIELGMFQAPHSVLVEIDSDHHRKLDLTIYYKSPQTGETLHVTFFVDTTAETIDWTVLENIDESMIIEIKTMAHALLRSIERQTKSEYEVIHPKPVLREKRAQRRIKIVPVEEYLPDEINEHRRNVKAEIRKRQEVEAKTAEDLKLREAMAQGQDSIKVQIVDPIDAIDERISGLPDEIRTQLRDAIIDFNGLKSIREQKSRYGFTSMRTRELGGQLLKFRINGYRVLMVPDEALSEKGTWSVRIFNIGSKKENYKRLGLSN